MVKCAWPFSLIVSLFWWWGFVPIKKKFVVFRALILKGLKRKERVASSIGSIMGFG